MVETIICRISYNKGWHTEPDTYTTLQTNEYLQSTHLNSSQVQHLDFNPQPP